MAAWVLAAATMHDLKSALRAAEDLPHRRTVSLGEATACLEFEGDAPAVPRRVERRLGHPVEARMDCDVASYRSGRGYLVFFVYIDERVDALDALLDDWGLGYREVTRTSLASDAVRVCTPLAAVADRETLSRALVDAGFLTGAIYEVGACSR